MPCKFYLESKYKINTFDEFFTSKFNKKNFPKIVECAINFDRKLPV